MPKRRMTPARRQQIKQWQLAGVKARASTSWSKPKPKPYQVFPHGKTRLLYHRTTEYNADRLIRNQKWAEGDRVYFSNRRNGISHQFGKAVIKIKIPRKKAHTYYVFGGREVSWVSVKDLQGTKIRRG